MTIELVVGYIAAALSLTSFLMKSMLPLRIAAMASNVAFILYGYLEWILPALILHVILLPVNARRAWEIRKLVRDIEQAKADSPVAEWLLPHMTRRPAKAGEVLWRKGDTAEEMLYIHSGRVRLVEYDEPLGPGVVLGEIGLFSPERKRTQSVTCETECELYSLTSDAMHRLYYQNPRLGFHIMRLVVARLMRDAKAREESRPGPIADAPGA